MDPLTILIVDDDADMRLYLRSCLRSMGLEVGRVLEAADGLEALPLVRTVAVNVVVSDVVLPGLDGYRLCRAIKDDPELRHVAVLLISGEERGPAADIQADGFLPKPFNTHQLRGALEALPSRLPRAPPEPSV